MNVTDQTQEALDVGIPTWKFIWGAIRFRPWRYIFNNIAFTTFKLGWLVPGLVSREFFSI